MSKDAVFQSAEIDSALKIAHLQQLVVSSVSSSQWVRQGDIVGVAQLITQQVARLLGIERVSVWLFNDGKDELICQDIYLLSQGTHSSGAILKKAQFQDEFNALYASKCVDASDPYTDPRTRGYVDSYLRSNNITSMLDAVVRIGEDLIGLVCFEHVNTQHIWRDDEVVFSSQLGDQVALVVSIARANAIHAELEQRDAQLLALNEQLEQRVQERTASLKSANEALLQSERLAALGSIVAGVAHELNTPIGNARMVATTLLDNAKSFERMVQSGALQKSALQEFMVAQQKGAALLDYSLEKAASLISSFKSVSADQTSGAFRRFSLDAVVSDILEMLSPTLSRSQCKVQVRKSIDGQIEMDSFPGALGQVVTNLINNALSHAFECRNEGVVDITVVALNPEWLELTFKDDGCGIPAQHLSQIFNPFFTTKLGKGGSGLGLHLVYNIVTKTLGGDVSVRSKPSEGTTFRFQLPITAPTQSDTG